MNIGLDVSCYTKWVKLYRLYLLLVTHSCNLKHVGLTARSTLLVAKGFSMPQSNQRILRVHYGLQILQMHQNAKQCKDCDTPSQVTSNLLMEGDN